MIYGMKKMSGKVKWNDDHSIVIEKYDRVLDRQGREGTLKSEIVQIRK